MAYDHNGDAAVHAPNSVGTPFSDDLGVVDDSWAISGDLVRRAQTIRSDVDDDFTQPGILVREVFSEAQREEFVATVAGHLKGGVHGDVLQRAFEYWKNVDAEIGQRIEEAYWADDAEPNPGSEDETAMELAGTKS